MDSRKRKMQILVTRLRFMGDIILTTPLLHALRKPHPEACIVYLAEHPYASLLEHHPAVDEVLVLHKSRAFSQFKLIVKLMRRRFDVAIDPRADHHRVGRLGAPGQFQVKRHGQRLGLGDLHLGRRGRGFGLFVLAGSHGQQQAKRSHLKQCPACPLDAPLMIRSLAHCFPWSTDASLC